MPAPIAPILSWVTDTFFDHVEIVWDHTDWQNVDRYHIYAGDSEFGTYSKVATIWSGQTMRYDLYSFNKFYDNNFDAKLTAPVLTAPTNVTVTSGGFADKIVINWTPGGIQAGARRWYKITAENSYGESDFSNFYPGRRSDTMKGCEIIARKLPDGAFSEIADGLSPSYNHTGLSQGDSFEYRLRMESTNGLKSPLTTAKTGSTTSPPQTAPSAPSVHFSSDDIYDRVRLSWFEPSNNGNAGTVAYWMYMADQPTTPIAEWARLDQQFDTTELTQDILSSVVASLGSITVNLPSNLGATKDQTAHSDKIVITCEPGNIDAGPAKYFRVRAVNSVNSSLPPDGNSMSGAVLGKLNDTKKSCEVQYAPDSGGSPGSWSALPNGSDVTGSVEHTGLSTNETYWYRIRTKTNQGQVSDWCTAFSGNTSVIPDAPSSPELSVSGAHNIINLSWDAQSPVSTYYVRASQGFSGTKELVKQLAGTETSATVNAAELAAPGVGITLEEVWVNTPTINSVTQGVYEGKIIIGFTRGTVVQGGSVFFRVDAENAGGTTQSPTVAGYLYDEYGSTEIEYHDGDNNWQSLPNAVFGVNTIEDTHSLSTNHTRYYRIRTKAKNSGTTSNWTDGSHTGSTGGAAAQVPGKIGNVRISEQYHDKVVLRWNKDPEATGYKIYVYNTGTQQWDLLTTVGNIDVLEIDSGVDSGLTAPSVLAPVMVSGYPTQNLSKKIEIAFDDSNKVRRGASRTYSIKGNNSAGDSAEYSSGATGSRGDTLPTGGGCEVVYDQASDGSFTDVLNGPSNRTTSPATHNFLNDGDDFYYKLKLVSANGYESSWVGPVYGKAKDAVTGPSAPQNLTATAGDYFDKVELDWDAVSGADGYYVYASNPVQPYSWTKIGTITGATAATITIDGAGGTVKEARLTNPKVSLPQDIQATQGDYHDKVRLTWTNGILTKGDSVAFAVSAYNSDGESSKSTEATGYRKGVITGTEVVVSKSSDGTYVQLVVDDASPYDHATDVDTGEALLPDSTRWYKLKHIVGNSA